LRLSREILKHFLFHPVFLDEDARGDTFFVKLALYLYADLAFLGQSSSCDPSPFSTPEIHFLGSALSSILPERIPRLFISGKWPFCVVFSSSDLRMLGR